MSETALYAVSPPQIVLAEFLPLLEETLATGIVKAFQLRLKEADDAQINQAARETLTVCRRHDIAFILNDRADLAAHCGADGVHLGQEDMPVAEARAIIGKEAIIGVSCHASRDMAIDAAEAGADYVAFGAFYPTRSKPMDKVEKWGMPKPEILDWWSTHTTIPCVAIGGVTAENCAPLVEAGADFIAVITALWQHPKGPAVGAMEFAERIAEVGQARK